MPPLKATPVFNIIMKTVDRFYLIFFHFYHIFLAEENKIIQKIYKLKIIFFNDNIFYDLQSGLEF